MTCSDYIKLLEKIYGLMINLNDVKDEKLRQQEILKAGKLMAKAGLITEINNTHDIISYYNKYIRSQIRNFIKTNK